MALIEVQSLKKRFGSVVAVDDISFSVERGEVLGFLGPNGAGKSTSMKVIAGVLAPTAGTAIVGGVDVRIDPTAVKRRLGYLPEGSPLYGDMTSEELLTFVGRARGMNASRRRAAVADVMGHLGLDAMAHRRIETLSKGYRRRVGVAQAIMHDPDVLVLDEPTDGLDPNQKHDVRELIRSMSASKAIIISTHILEEVDAVCDRVIIIDRGRIVANATTAELYSRSPDFNSVSLAVSHADRKRAIKVLSGIVDVALVEEAGRPENNNQLVARPREGRFIGDAVSLALAQAGITPIELHGTVVRLDDIFRTITNEEGRPEG
jgi:ABC-2 type transport system ATP-binding protein